MMYLILAIAVIWPILLCEFYEKVQVKHNDRKHSVIANLSDANFSSIREQIANIHEFIEQQDALIAALWEKVYGHEFSQGGYVDEHFVSTTCDSLKKAWNVRPAWTVQSDYVCYEFNYLQRRERYPWGHNALWLRKSGDD
jgi:hypothetical protein